MIINWREAKRTDRARLQAIRCTSEASRDASGRPRRHAKPWEWEVQAFIRTRTPPAGPGDRLLLGERDGALVAVSCFELVLAELPTPVIKLQAIAVDVELRGLGGEVANSALEQTIESSVSLAASRGAREAILIAWVDPRNGPSRLLLERHGFGSRGMLDSGLEDWVLEVDRE